MQISKTEDTSRDARSKIVVIGAGPAGLTAVATLLDADRRLDTLILEETADIGGISRTVVYKDWRCDIGGHRFFSKVQAVNEFWARMLGNDFIEVDRLSRIFYRGKFFQYPIKIFDVAWKLGIYESVRVALSYVKWQVRPSKREESMEEWVINRFGGRLYKHFFRSYTEKVWGRSGASIRADWAAQRIKTLTLWGAVVKAVTGSSKETSLIERFQYPRLGPGMMWERVRDYVVDRGARVEMEAPVTRVRRTDDMVTGVETTHVVDGRTETTFHPCDELISSMPLQDLILCMDPPAPREVQDAARKLGYRDFLIVMLILDHADPFPDNWVYIHAPDVKVGRIQNFRAWSAEMCPDPDKASIGMEYFCQENDKLWSMADADLIAFGAKELQEIGFAPVSSVVDGTVIRQPKAYPVYDETYKKNLDVIRDWLSTISNLQVIGRNGMHRYNNQDHSMLTGMLAAHNILGASHDLWEVNTERSYQEEFLVDPKARREHV